MTEVNNQGCCWGTEVAGTADTLDPESVRTACQQVIRDAIRQQQRGEQSSPVIIDGLPSIGKTHQATAVASGLDNPVAILTHRYETRDEHLGLADRFDERVVEIPAFDHACPTK